MSVAQIEALAAGAQKPERPAQRDEAGMRRMAQQFEAVLLNQLTASLNPAENEDEEGLFSNSGGGMALSKQMFSEQFAKTMSESGGIGLADLIMSQVGPGKSAAGNRNPLRALAASREIRAAAKTSSLASGDVKPTPADSPTDSNSSTQNPVVSASATSRRLAPESFGPATSQGAAFSTRPRRVHETESEVKLPTKTSSISSRSSVANASSETGPIRSGLKVALHYPVSGAIRSTFGPRVDPINGRHRFHKGVDIAATRGTPIAAAAAGKVVFAGKNKGYGNMVMIEHADGRRTLYAHAERLFVKAGDTVTAGQTVAAVGSTGHSTGPHLHFEVREGNRAVNPLTILANDLTLTRR